MRCFAATAGIAACTLLASCGPSEAQWDGYRQCMSDRRSKSQYGDIDPSAKYRCAEEYGFNLKEP